MLTPGGPVAPLDAAPSTAIGRAEYEWRYRQLFDGTPVPIVVADFTVAPAVIVDVNRCAELVYGYAAADLVSSPVASLGSEAWWSSVHDLARRCSGGARVTAETTHQRRDGTTFSVRVTASRQPVRAGRMILIMEEMSREAQARSEAEAIDGERLRIAHEVHDGVAQDLASLQHSLTLWSLEADVVSPVMSTTTKELQVRLGSVIADIRRAIFALRPLDLDAQGFAAAIGQLVTDFGRKHELSATLDAAALDSLPIASELPIFRIVQEGLSNIARHARATNVRVSLRVDPRGGVALSLEDDGCGFDRGLIGSAEHRGHVGLRQMRERILRLSGTLDIQSASGSGTELLVTLPPAIA